MTFPTSPAERLLTLGTVIERTTYSRSSIYAMIARGDFPAPVPIGPNRVAWPESAVAKWIANKINPTSDQIGETKRKGM